MKKIKLFALAALLMGSTSVFAQTQSDGTWKYDIISAAKKTAALQSLVDSKKGTVENLQIPATVEGEDGATYTIIAIEDGAFADDAKIKTVTFTANIESIGDDAFLNVYNMTTVTFPAGSKLNYIGDGAFAETSALEKIDLSNTKVTDFGTTTPFVKGINVNPSLEEIVLAANTSNIGTALANCTALKKTNIASTRIQHIYADAFSGDKKLTSLELPAIYYYNPVTGEQEDTPQPTYLWDDALAGSYITTLTINGSVDALGIGVLGATTLTEVTFKGVVGDEYANVAISTGAFVGNKGLAKVTFGEVLEGAIGTGSFTDCATDADGVTPKGTLAFKITKAEACVFEDEAVFAAAALADPKKNNVNLSAPNAAVGLLTLHRVNFTPYVPPVPAAKLPVYGTSTFYGKFINRTGASLAINRADAVVYSAYVDGSKLYIDPLQSVKGQQIIPNGQAVVVKATSAKTADDGSKYIEFAKKADGTPASTIRYKSASTVPVNDLSFLDVADGVTPGTDEYITAATLKAYDDTKVLYVVGDLNQGLKWQTPKDAVRLYDNTVYVFADPEAAGGRLEIIWLDGSEPTAIQKVETESENNDAIYNLQGVRVNKAGKGVYIQNGKKFIVK